MPQPPNMQQMLKQVQKMQQDMEAAQEQLKNEEVEASAGGGMVTVKVSGDLVDQGDHDRPRGGRPRRRRAAAGHGPGRHQRGAARRQELQQDAGSAAWPAAWTWASLGLPGFVSACMPPPVQRLITELAKLPGIGKRTAQRLAFHILRSDAEDANALADAIREVKERIGLCEVCFNLADGPRCRICLDERRDAAPDLRRRGARRRHPDRAHARVPRALPRARRRAVADRRRRPRGPEDRRALRARAEPAAIARGGARHQPDDDGRGDRAAHRRGAARARARRRR